MNETRSTIHIVVETVSATSRPRIPVPDSHTRTDDGAPLHHDPVVLHAVQASIRVASSIVTSSTPLPLSRPSSVRQPQPIPLRPSDRQPPLAVSRPHSLAQPLPIPLRASSPQRMLPIPQPSAIARRDLYPVSVSPTRSLPPTDSTAAPLMSDQAQLPPVPPTPPHLTGSATLPPYPEGLSPKTITRVVSLAAVLLFLLAVTVLFYQPLAQVTEEWRHRIQQETITAQQQAEYHATEQRLQHTNHALQQLRSANTRIASQVESILGQPLDAAIADPPTRLRHALLYPSPTSTAWDTLRYAHIPPSQLASAEDFLATVASHIGQHAVTPSDQGELDKLLSWIQKRQEALDAVNLDFLTPYRNLDARHATTTITAAERR